MTFWANMTFFIWLLLTAMKVHFKPIILINQNDKRGDPECYKPGTKIELKKNEALGKNISGTKKITIKN